MDNTFFVKLRQAVMATLPVLAADFPLVIITVQTALQLLVEKLST